MLFTLLEFYCFFTNFTISIKMNFVFSIAIFCILELSHCDAKLFKDRPYFARSAIENSKKIEIPKNAPLRSRKFTPISCYLYWKHEKYFYFL